MTLQCLMLIQLFDFLGIRKKLKTADQYTYEVGPSSAFLRFLYFGNCRGKTEPYDRELFVAQKVSVWKNSNPESKTKTCSKNGLRIDRAFQIEQCIKDGRHTHKTIQSGNG